MKLGISSYTFPWSIGGIPGYESPDIPMDQLQLLDKAKALGVQVLQIADNLPLHMLGMAELEQMRDQAFSLGIEIEVGTRGLEPGHLLTYLDISRFLGARLLRTMIHSETSQPDLKQAELWLNSVLPSFAEAGVVIALENYEAHTARDLANLVSRIDSPYLGICLDTANSFGAMETLPQIIQELGPYVLNLHIKDFVIQRVPHKMGFLVTGCPAGTGFLDITRLLGEIRRFGKDLNVILEQWPPFQRNINTTISQEHEWAIAGVAYLQKILTQRSNGR